MAPKSLKGKPRRSGNGSQKKADPISSSTRAGTIFPGSRCNRYLKQGRYSTRYSAQAGVFMAAVLEYLSAEILELAGNMCEQMKKKTITNQHINLGMRNDEELAKLIHMVQFSQGGQL